MKRKIIVVDGTIEIPSKMTEDEFNDLFLNFIESNNLSFNGGTELQEVEQ